MAHRSGIGDYLDEDTMTESALSSRSTARSTEDYLAILDGFPPASAPGERFAYNNGGFVVLALIAERASGVSFHRLGAAGLRSGGYS